MCGKGVWSEQAFRLLRRFNLEDEEIYYCEHVNCDSPLAAKPLVPKVITFAESKF